MKPRSKTFYIIRDYLMLTFASFLYAFSWQNFVLCNNLTGGGMMGLCAIIQYATGGAIPVDLSYLVFNIVLLVAGFMVLGKGFGFKTIFCIAISALFFRLVPLWEAPQCLPGHFLYVPERFMIPILAGIGEALALGTMFIYGGSSGGSDILALIINKYWPVSTGKFFLVSDFLVVLCFLFLPDKTFADVVYGCLMIVTFSVVIDFVYEGRKSNCQMLVFSEHYSDIADFIINDLERGVTALDGTGWYTGNEKKVLLVIIRSREIRAVTAAIKDVDPNAFVSVTPASSVYGEGFEEIKTGINLKKKS